MKLFENIDDGPAVLYHGTKPALLPKIRQHGLLAEHDGSWREFGQGVYLTNNAETASNYGAVVLEIDVRKLHYGNMVPDDYELMDGFEGSWDMELEHHFPNGDAPSGIFECSWLDSLKICGQCQYLGDIPPEAIRNLATFKA